MTTVRRIVAFFVLPILPLGSLICQQTPAQPQKSSGSELVLNFGPTASNSEGKAAADRFLQAMGGPARVNAVKTLRQTVVAMRQGQRMELEQSIVYPDKQAQKMTLPQGKALLVVTPTDAFMVLGGRLQNLPPTQRAALDATLKHDFINILQQISDPRYVFVATGQEKVGNAEATVVDVEADGVPTRWWIAADGKLLQERYSDMTQAGGSIQTMTYADWKSCGGLKYPTKYELFSEAGQPQMSMTLTAMQVNPVVIARPSRGPHSDSLPLFHYPLLSYCAIKQVAALHLQPRQNDSSEVSNRDDGSLWSIESSSSMIASSIFVIATSIR